VDGQTVVLPLSASGPDIDILWTWVACNKSSHATPTADRPTYCLVSPPVDYPTYSHTGKKSPPCYSLSFSTYIVILLYTVSEINDLCLDPQLKSTTPGDHFSLTDAPQVDQWFLRCSIRLVNFSCSPLTRVSLWSLGAEEGRWMAHHHDGN
jgi:hypothetical protein